MNGQAETPAMARARKRLAEVLKRRRAQLKALAPVDDEQADAKIRKLLKRHSEVGGA